MIPQIVAAVQTIEPGLEAMPLEAMPQKSALGGMPVFPCIMLLVGIAVWGLIIFGIIQLIRFLGSARKEQKLIRMELSKLADEVGQIRQGLKNGAEKGPLANGEGDL